MRASILQGTRSLKVVGAVLLALILLPAPAGAGSLEIVGYSGYLGEWELTATVTEEGSTTPKEYSGPLLMKHVGLCTQDGPEEKSGKIRIQMLQASSRIAARLWVDGVECGYQGALSDFYSGTMNCSGREKVPLKLWITESR